MRDLVAAIVYRALQDWKRHKADVREFFNSQWGQELCDIIDLSAKDILAKLESGKINVNTLEEL